MQRDDRRECLFQDRALRQRLEEDRNIPLSERELVVAQACERHGFIYPFDPILRDSLEAIVAACDPEEIVPAGVLSRIFRFKPERHRATPLPTVFAWMDLKKQWGGLEDLTGHRRAQRRLPTRMAVAISRVWHRLKWR
ncbi:MAG: hypothetical protein ACRD1T_26435, partial [Acidimicrobiia bacterium]